jgi:hypothetical protein
VRRVATVRRAASRSWFTNASRCASTCAPPSSSDGRLSFSTSPASARPCSMPSSLSRSVSARSCSRCLPPLPVEAAHRSRLNDASRMVRAHPSSAATAMPSARRDERAVDAASEARPNEPALDCRLALEPRAVAAGSSSGRLRFVVGVLALGARAFAPAPVGLTTAARADGATALRRPNRKPDRCRGVLRGQRNGSVVGTHLGLRRPDGLLGNRGSPAYWVRS